MSEGRHFFPIPKILILLSFFVVYSTAQNNKPPSSCSSSSCGNIRISYPYRLKSDPRSCGFNRPNFELECRNNQTLLTVTSKSYLVQEIDYDFFTIKLIDPNINRGNLSSCPLYSNYYDDWDYTISSSYFDLNTRVTFIHCLNAVNSSKYVPATFCGNRSSNFINSSQIHSYIITGERMTISDLEDSCTVDRVVLASPVELMWNNSLASIYDAMANGFVFTWFRAHAHCVECERSNGFCRLEGNKINCKEYCSESTRISELSFKCKFEYWGLIIGFYSSFALAGLAALKFVLGFPLLVALVVYKCRRRHLAMDETIEEFLQSQNNLTPIKYTYSELKKMTNNFNQRLGEGAYGTVYKGKLRSGPYVAVKMMKQSMASEQEFISEVGTIGRIHHVNVVQLIGFCVEGSKCALVYEYLPNGSLDRYIFNQQGIEVIALRYEKMYEIALGVARGIDYLHRGCDMQILHFDIKPHNILLDEKFHPKISDFGLAKLQPTEGSFVLTAARGTMGYMAPEMFYKNVGGVSYKADVYSFGMLLMEMASRRKNMNPFANDVGQIYFPSWVYEQLHAGKELEIKDATEEERKMIKRVIVVALWCIQMKPSDRPAMNRVVEMLEGESELQMPPKPFMAPREIADDHGIRTTPPVLL
ncbi:hypothetical protein ACS0TY_010534 [Phlomoides rotata]